MNRCRHCDIILFDHTQVCPLCHSVTEEMEEEDKAKARALFGGHAPYPDAGGRTKFVRFLLRLILFLFALSEVIMIAIDHYTGPGYPWSLVTGACMLYTYLFLCYWITHDSGFAAKVGLQILITMVFLFEIDYLNGFHRWSLQWAIPSIILAGDAMVFLLMMLNRSRWQSYLLLLLLLGISSVLIVILHAVGVISSVVLPLTSCIVTVFYFFGTILFGGRAAGRELKRRFHI